MPPKGSKKRAAEDTVYKSKPSLKQKKFPPRITAIKAAAQDEEPPKKRRKSGQPTMTQLEFGNRSFFDVIKDSDDEEDEEEEEESVPVKEKATRRRSKFAAKTESQDTLTQLAARPPRSSRSNSDRKNSPATKPKPRTSRRKSKLPEKTESQDTMTQFVKRSSDMGGMIIGDTDDEDDDFDLDLGDVGEQASESVAPKAAPPEGQHQVEDPPVAEAEGAEAEAQPDADVSNARDPLTGPSNDSSGHPTISEKKDAAPKTPKRVRILAIPSSRSPPDTHLSTQATPRQFESIEQRSPLQERSVNIQSTVRKLNLSKSTEKSLSGIADASKSTSKIVGDQESILRPTDSENDASLQAASRNDEAYAPGEAEQSSPVQASISLVREESGTQMRVREFNRGWAQLEEETARLRSRRPQFPNPRTMMVRSSTSMSSARVEHARHEETQYEGPGDETMREAFDDEELDVDQSSPLKQTVVLSKEDEAILIPSSQKDSAARSTSADIVSSSQTPVSDDNPLPANSIPTGSSREAELRRKDTQELASEQLQQETQAHMVQVVSSPKDTQAHAISHASLGRQVRPSQATTADETNPYSTYRTQLPMPTFKDPTQFQDDEELIIASSPTGTPVAKGAPVHVHVPSSPLPNPPAVPPSSSFAMPEPETPKLLRNMKGPLKMSDLVSDSVGYSIPLPPSWPYGDEDEDEDDEL